MMTRLRGARVARRLGPVGRLGRALADHVTLLRRRLRPLARVPRARCSLTVSLRLRLLRRLSLFAGPRVGRLVARRPLPAVAGFARSLAAVGAHALPAIATAAAAVAVTVTVAVAVAVTVT